MSSKRLSYEEERRECFAKLGVTGEAYEKYDAECRRLKAKTAGVGMTLREKVMAAIKGKKTLKGQAIAVCVLMNRELDLAGNGWFDDDKVMCNRLGIDYSDGDEGEDEG